MAHRGHTPRPAQGMVAAVAMLRLGKHRAATEGSPMHSPPGVPLLQEASLPMVLVRAPHMALAAMGAPLNSTTRGAQAVATPSPVVAMVAAHTARQAVVMAVMQAVTQPPSHRPHTQAAGVLAASVHLLLLLLLHTVAGGVLAGVGWDPPWVLGVLERLLSHLLLSTHEPR